MPTQSTLPPGAVPLSPPAKYRFWWSMVESCSGHTGDFDSVRWYVLPGAERLPNGASGQWHGATREILLVEHVPASTARHEILHALLPVHGHPRDQFLGRCDGMVACSPECEVDAGGRIVPAEDAPEILPRDVGARIDLAPPEPSESANDGALAVILSIRNPHPYEVWVRLTLTGQKSRTFALILDAGDSTQPTAILLTSIEGTRFGLGPNETRRAVVDHSARAGSLGVRAFFNVDSLPRVVFEVKN